MRNQAWGAMAYLSAGLLLGMIVHACFYRTDPKGSPKGTGILSGEERRGPDPRESNPQEMDLSSSKQLMQTFFLGTHVGRANRTAPLDPLAVQVRSILRNPVSSRQKVTSLINLAKTLPPEQRRLAYAGAAFACEAREFQQLMLPLIWDPATPADQAQVLAGGVIVLPDPVRLPICLTFLKHRDESIRLTGQAVLAAYFPDADASAYPAMVQAYLAHPDH